MIVEQIFNINQMKLKHLFGAVVLTMLSSVAFVSCDKDDKKNDEPVIINQKADYAKELVGDYNATIEASAHGATTATKVILKVRATAKNVIALDIPEFAGRGTSMVGAFTLPNVNVIKKGDVYVLTASKQVIPMTMGGDFPESEITATGSINKDNVLSMSLTWDPMPKYKIQITIKDGKKIMK